MKAVIMAGGKGSRIASVRADIPKPMIPIAGKPVLEHQIRSLYKQGVREVVLTVGHLGCAIRHYFGDGNALREDGLSTLQLSYLTENEPLGTAGALYDLQDRMQKDFLLINGDLIFDVDFGRMKHAHEQHVAKGGLATVLTHPNHHPYDSAVLFTDHEHRICDWLHKEDARGWYPNRVNAGIHMFSPGIFPYLRGKGYLRERKQMDLDRDILKPMTLEGLLYAYDSPEYVRDMGTPERWREAEVDYKQGIVAARSLRRQQRAVFLDRDGTINENAGFITSPKQFRLLSGAAEAIRMLNSAGYLVIVATNQPVIARGEVTLDQLEEIHNKMQTLLGEKGAWLDAIYFCPHHPHRGFAGERVEYKVECDCRKPKPGMLLRAAADFHISLGESWMVGDQERDIIAGKNAGCHTAGLYGCAGAEQSFDTLKEFAFFLCGKEKTGYQREEPESGVE